MNRLPDNITEAFNDHLKTLRGACGDAAEHVTKSREALKHSFALLRLADKIEAEQRS
jgi:hypothetical protein